MANELKIVIDADVNKAVAGVKTLSKAITSDFTNATISAGAASTKLSSDVAASVSKINASFQQIKPPSLGFGVLSFDSSKAIADVKRFKDEIGTIKVNPIDIPVNPPVIPPITTGNIPPIDIPVNVPKVPPIPPVNIPPINIPPVPPNTIKSINELEKELDELKSKINFSRDVNEIKKLGDEFRRIESQINNIKVAGNISGQLDKIGLAGKRAADNLKNVPKSSNAATLSLINLGRVAQDAPFGIIGIANNINPLLESFQRLRAESS